MLERHGITPSIRIFAEQAALFGRSFAEPQINKESQGAKKMAFADISFLYLFLPLCLIIYYACRKTNIKNYVLIVFSLIFYAWGQPAGIIFLLISTVANYITGIFIQKHEDTKAAQIAVTAMVLVNIAGLALFKYTSFVLENINVVFHSDIRGPEFIPPLGISYFTFRAISYIVDCHWGKVKAQKSFSKFLLYTSLFPHMTAGPIVRYKTVENELSERKVSYTDFSAGLNRTIAGLAKKVIIANNLYAIVEDFFIGSDTAVNIASRSVADTWYAVVIYALFMYFDFSGYSDMAIGIARLFGFKFDENFNYPFMCRSITEFWQRWHISLGTFFRDYLLYLPIFGRRTKYASLFLVWFCTGLWHGASWNYIIWGLYFGLLILIEQLITKKRLKKIPAPIMHIYTKLTITIGFGIFFFTDLSKLGDFFKNLVGANGNTFCDAYFTSSLTNNLWLIFAAVIFSFPVVPKLKATLEKSESANAVFSIAQIAVNMALLIICTIFISLQTSNPFFYANF